MVGRAAGRAALAEIAALGGVAAVGGTVSAPSAALPAGASGGLRLISMSGLK